MTPEDLMHDLRGRINPQYANMIGTESHERKQCADAIDLLIGQRDQLAAELAEVKAERDALKARLAEPEAEPVGVFTGKFYPVGDNIVALEPYLELGIGTIALFLKACG